MLDDHHQGSGLCIISEFSALLAEEFASQVSQKALSKAPESKASLRASESQAAAGANLFPGRIGEIMKFNVFQLFMIVQ